MRESEDRREREVCPQRDGGHDFDEWGDISEGPAGAPDDEFVVIGREAVQITPMGSHSTCRLGTLPAMPGTESELLTLQMPAGTWSGMDGRVDNLGSLAAVDGDSDVLAETQAIRQAGWDQVPWVNGEWPPKDQVIHITLSRRQWALVLGESHESLATYEEFEDDESAELCRQAIVVIEAGLVD